MVFQPTGLEPGIYFGLPEEIYFSDPALSRSCLKLLEFPAKYWAQSPLNPERKRKDPTPAMKEGRDLHMALLEPDRFMETYRCVPGDPVDTRKPMERIRYKRYMAMAATVKKHPIIADFLEWGAPEVTLVCPDPITGVMLRSRHDFFGSWYSLDYKTTGDLTIGGLKASIRKYSYKLQVYFYTWMRIEIRELIKAGKVCTYGPEPKGLMKRFMAEEADMFYLLLQEKEEPFCFDRIYLNQKDIEDGMLVARERIDTYITYMEKYGPDTPWPQGEGLAKEFSTHLYEGFVGREEKRDPAGETRESDKTGSELPKETGANDQSNTD